MLPAYASIEKNHQRFTRKGKQIISFLLCQLAAEYESPEGETTIHAMSGMLI